MLRRASLLFIVATFAACASRTEPVAAARGDQQRLTDVAGYREARARLIEQERAMRLGAGLVLTTEEEAANRRLLALKQAEFDRTPGYVPAAHSFLDNKVKELLASSPVFEVMRRMPKGGILHSHGTAGGDFRWLIQHATYRADAYIYLGTDPQAVPGALRISKLPLGEGWRLISELRATAPDAKTFDEGLYRSITLGEEDRNSPDIWVEFSRCFQRFTGLLFGDRAVLDDYWRQLLLAMSEENIQYLETRNLPISDAVVQEARVRDPDFSINYIATGGRSATRERLAQTLDAVLDRRAKDPRVVGFDLVEEEDRTNTNLFFLEELLAARRKADLSGVGLPLYLHSGETSSVDNENVHDAILLGALRIGHGLALIKHPLLMDMVKARGIAVEICPISNQLLGYVPDLRNHPAVHYIAAGIPIVLSPDDPAIMQHSLSHDFYVAFMAWGLDLRVLKQIAINSLVYSAMQADEKQRALAAWEHRWAAFITWVNARDAP